MTEKELDDPSSINFLSKERIAKASGKSLEDVSRMLFYFQQSRIMQEWLVMKYVFSLLL
jgi:signal recognition particle GTPase